MKRRDLFRTAGAGLLLSSSAAAQSSRHEAFAQLGKRMVLDLNGPWQLSMDPNDSGVGKRWFTRPPTPSQARRLDVVVPSVWQQYLELQGGIGWYFKDLQISKELLGKILRLRFEAVDYRAQIWLNGQQAGTHEGGFTPFEVDVTRAAKAGTNRLAVRVSDVGRDFRTAYCGLPGWEKTTSKRVDGLTFSEIPAGFQDWREGFDHGGIWQPVTLIATDPVYVADLFLVPNLVGASVEARVTIVNRSERAVDAEVVVEVRPWKGAEKNAGGNSGKVRLEPGATPASVQIALPRAHAWSLSDPFLYIADAAIRTGSEAVDNTSARFGMREFTVGNDGVFYLNGKQLFVKGAHYQSTEPVTLAFPRNRDAARQIVEIAKEGGFNFIRSQGRPTVPAILDAADELGILFQCEPAVSKMADNPQMDALAEREVTDMVLRDRNHPSVVIWNMINEQAAGMKVVERMCQIARKLDPTRLITESAGGNSHYYAPGRTEGVSYLTEHYYPGAPLPEGMLAYLKTRGVEGQLYFVTEFGYGGLEDIDAVLEKYGAKPREFVEDYQGFVRQKQDVEESYRKSGFQDIFPTLASLRDAAQSVQANAVRLHVEAMRSNPKLRGYNIVQLFDSNSNEVDGLVDFWRNKRKPAFAAIQELNRPLALIVQCGPFNITPGDETEVTVAFINEEHPAGTKTVRLRGVDSTGNVVFKTENTFEGRPVVSVALRKRFALKAAPGRVRIEAEVLDGTSVLTKKTAAVDVYDPAAFRWPKRGFTIFDPQHRWPSRKAAPGMRKFEARAPRPEVVVIPAFGALWKQLAEFEQFLHAVEQARRGSTLLFLGVPSDGAVPEEFRRIHFHLQFSPLTVASVLGFRVDMLGGRGGWGRLVGPYGGGSGEPAAGSPVTRHPVFEGCPGPGLMDWEYGNVATDEIVQPSITSMEKTGPTIQVVPSGAGRIVFCTLRLLDNLGRDALAEKLLSNLVGYLDSTLPQTHRPPSARDDEALRFRLTQVRDCLQLLRV
jgi:hypothetical protein